MVACWAAVGVARPAPVRADDVMEALKISEQTRPTVGRTMMAATMGALGGGKIGAFIAPMIDVALRSGPSAQLVLGRSLGQLAQMLRTGNAAGVTSLLSKFQKAGFTGEAGNEARPEPLPIKEPQ